MKLSLIITTFDRPDALACVLRGLERQSHLPDELAIADDGSGAETRDLIADFRTRFARPVRHCWQPHEGFRVCRARNLALSRVTGDYVVIVDGDMVMHAHFIADHHRFARAGHWVQGTRILLDAQRTTELIASGPYDLSPWSPASEDCGASMLCTLPALSDRLGQVANAFVATKSCNLAAWRADLERVNGFNEDMIGWGPEDKELAARLAKQWRATPDAAVRRDRLPSRPSARESRTSRREREHPCGHVTARPGAMRAWPGRAPLGRMKNGLC